MHHWNNAMFGSSRSRVHQTRRRLNFERLEERYALSGGAVAALVAGPLPNDSTINLHSALAVPLPAAITAPVNFTGTPFSDTQVSLNWSATNGALGYNLYEFISGQPVMLATYPPTTTSTTVTNLTAGTDYAFNLVAFDGTSSAATPWISAMTTGAPSVLSPPASFTGSALSATQVALNWTATAGAAGYNLYEFVNNQPSLVATYDASTTTATISNLDSGTTYPFNLVAFSGQQFAATPWIGVTTTGGSQPVLAPQNFTAQPMSNTQIGLSWSPDSNATGFRLYEFLNGQPSLIATYGTGTTSATVNNLTANTTYSFNLVAFNSAESAATPWIAATTTSGPLAAPSNFVGAPLSSTEVTLSWSIAPNASGYQLYEFENGQPTQIATFDSSTTSTIVNSLAPNTQYAFNLVAFNNATTAATHWISVSTTL
jgi:large repetitive protein